MRKDRASFKENDRRKAVAGCPLMGGVHWGQLLPAALWGSRTNILFVPCKGVQHDAAK